MRVLQALEPAGGGLPEHVAEAAIGLARQGHEVIVAGPEDGRRRHAVEAAGATWVALPWDATVPSPRADRQVLRGLDALLRRAAPDVVHAHGQKAGMLARVAAHRCGVPSVWTPHTLMHRTQRHRPRRSAMLRSRIGLIVERRLGARTTLLAGCCESEARDAVRDGLVPAERTRVIDYGVDPDLTAAPHPALASDDGRPLLGLVAGLREQKGLPVLLDALELLAARGAPVRFAIVGEGPLWSEVRTRVRSELLAPTTALLPFEGRVEPYLAGLDALVLPSLWEGLPIGVLEAMAFGLPVVASAVDGTPEAVLDGTTGILVPPSDPAALAAALATMASDGDLRHRMGEAGRRHLLSRWTIPAMVRRSAEVLAEACAMGPRRRR